MSVELERTGAVDAGMARVVRFAEVVAKSGKPTLYLAWSAPGKDPSFQRALKEHRVMTLHQELRGGKKDRGEVGFREEAHAQYLIFPRSLRMFAERRVIAVDYSLFAGEGAKPPVPNEGKVKDRAGASSARKEKIKSSTPRSSKEPTAEVVPFPGLELTQPATPPKARKKKLPKLSRVLREEISVVLHAIEADQIKVAEERLKALLDASG